MIGRVGLKITVALGSLSTCISAAVTCIPASDTKFVALSIVSEFFAGISYSVFGVMRPKLPAVWFPPEQWTLSLSLIMLCPPFAHGVMFVLAPLVVPESLRRDTIRVMYYRLAYAMQGFALLSLTAVVVLFRDRPEAAPSRTSTTARHCTTAVPRHCTFHHSSNANVEKSFLQP